MHRGQSKFLIVSLHLLSSKVKGNSKLGLVLNNVFYLLSLGFGFLIFVFPFLIQFLVFHL